MQSREVQQFGIGIADNSTMTIVVSSGMSKEKKKLNCRIDGHIYWAKWTNILVYKFHWNTILNDSFQSD